MKSKMKKNHQGSKNQANRNQFSKRHVKNPVTRQDIPAAAADVLTDWFYMSATEMTAAAIKDALTDTAYQVEYWEAAQVLEISLGEGGSMDVEVMDFRLGEKDADAFLDRHQVKFLCYITFQPEDYEAARSVMEHICGRIGGFFCGDTEDFTPVIKG